MLLPHQSPLHKKLVEELKKINLAINGPRDDDVKLLLVWENKA